MLTKRAASVLFMLSIIAPVGAFATLKLTGILASPISQSITVEPAALTFPRPSETLENFGTNQSVMGEWSQDGASLSAGIRLLSYREGAAMLPFDGCDGLVFEIFVTATCTQGCVSSVEACFHLLDNGSAIYLEVSPYSLETINCSIVSWKYYGTNQTDACVNASSCSQSCYLRDQVDWVFLDEQGEDHKLETEITVTYASSDARRVVTIPIALSMPVVRGE